MGSDVIVEVHLQVSSTISVSEGHHIGEWVSRKLEQQFSEINDVIVHIDAEDDAIQEAREDEILLPLRKEVRAKLTGSWQTLLDFEDLIRVDLHYLNNRINVEKQ